MTLSDNIIHNHSLFTKMFPDLMSPCNIKDACKYFSAFAMSTATFTMYSTGYGPRSSDFRSSIKSYRLCSHCSINSTWNSNAVHDKNKRLLVTAGHVPLGRPVFWRMPCSRLCWDGRGTTTLWPLASNDCCNVCGPCRRDDWRSSRPTASGLPAPGWTRRHLHRTHDDY